LSEKKYPCLFGFKDECSTRRYVEENLESAQVAGATPEAKVVQKALKDTKSLQFDDEETAKRIGQAVGEGALKAMLAPILSTASLKPQLMVNYCGMCPTRMKEFTKAMSRG